MQESSRGHYTNLVLEGGGVLGVAYCGALAELESRGILSKIVNYAGASAGSIVAGALACGADSAYITSAMKNMKFRDFLDYGNKVRAVYNILYYKGACPGDHFCKWYGDIVKDLTGNANITLRELNQLYGGRVVISVVNLSRQRLEFWDYKTQPDMPLVLAVRASMSIQGIFMPVEINEDLYVDGGTLCNYPIKAFHYDGPEADTINPHTIGLMLMSDSEITLEYPKIDTLLQYGIACIECLWTQPQKIHMDEQDWVRTIKIPTGGVSSIDFNISSDDVGALIAAGQHAVCDYFNGLKTYSVCTFHCLRAPHTPADDMIVRKPSKLNLAGTKAMRKLARGDIVTPKNTSNEDWNLFRDDLIDIVDEETLLAEIELSASRGEKIKKTVGSSPPIRIEQFKLE